MEKKGKYTYLAKNTILFTISSFGSKLLSFFLVPFYTTILSTEDYGTADLITTTASLLIFAFTLNIGDSVLRFTIERKNNREEILNFGVKVLLIGSSILVLNILFCRNFSLFGWEDYCYLFLFLTFFTSAMNGIITNYLRAIDRIAAVAVSGIITTATIMGCNLLFLLVFRMGVIGYMLSNILGYVTSILYFVFLIRREIFIIFKSSCNNHTKVAMCRYSIPLIFNGIAWWMNSSIDKYFITAICGVGINGIYAVSQKIPSVLSMFNTIFGQAWNLSAIKEFDSEDKDGFFSNTYKIYNTGLVITCSILILINIPLAKLLFSNDFFSAWQYSSILLMSMLFSAMSSFLGSVFSAVKNSKIFAISTVIAAIVNMILNAVLIPWIGAVGAAIATLISFFSVWLIRLLCVRKYICMRISVFTDCIAYILLILQIIFEHFANHMYIGQIIVFIGVVLLYRNNFIKIIREIFKKIRK